LSLDKFPCNVSFGFPNKGINFKAGQIYMPKNPSAIESRVLKLMQTYGHDMRRSTEFQIFELQQPLMQLYLQPKLPESNSLKSYAKSTLKWCSNNKLKVLGLTIGVGLTVKGIKYWIFNDKK
jgi:hypothetical protein